MKKLYIGGVSYSTTNESLAAAFRESGVVYSVEIRMDAMTGRSKGFGFVEMESESEVKAAIEMWNGKELDGRRLTVTLAKPRKQRPELDWNVVQAGDSQLANNENERLLTEFLCDRPFIETTNSVSIAFMKYLQAHPMDLKKINRRRFEELIAEIWSGFGYSVELTQPTCDGGIDVIAVRKNIVEERYLIECKRPDIGNCVGILPVRALYGVLVDDGATKAILATTGHFSKEAIIFFNDHKWRMESRNFEGVMEWLKEYLHRKA